MRSNLLVLSVIFLLLVPPLFAFDPDTLGGKEGHGGAVVVCYSKDKELKSATVLDIWEQREEHGLNPKAFNLEYYQIAETLASRLEYVDPIFFKSYRKELGRIHKNMKEVGAQSSLEPVKDYWPYIKPELGCKIEQLAVYKGDGYIIYEPKFWSRLDAYNKAALLIHETIFYILRDQELVHDSHKARTIVAYLMSTLSNVDFADIYKTKIKDMNVGSTKDVRISEVIRGEVMKNTGNDVESRRAAENSWKQACEKWKGKVMEEIRIQPKLLHCNNAKVEAIKDEIVGTSGKSHSAITGYQAWSEGLIQGFIDDFYIVNELEKVGLSSSSVDHLHSEEKSLNALQNAESSLASACEQLKANARGWYKERLVYVFCEDPKFSREIARQVDPGSCEKSPDHKHYVSLSTHGKIIYVLNSRDEE